MLVGLDSFVQAIFIEDRMGKKELTEKQKREETAYQFDVQAHSLGLRILKKRSNFVYELHDNQLEHNLVAIALQCSFDFYEYRLNRNKQRIDLLLVQRHNAVCPVAVLELSSGTMFTAGAIPSIERINSKRRNSEEVSLFISKVILGLNGVDEELSSMKPRTRQWYLQRKDEYLRGRVGRPWSS